MSEKEKNEKEIVEENAQQEVENNNNSEENVKEESVIEEKDPTDELNAKLAELNDKYLRLYSDFDNYRKRTAKEKVELISSAGAGILKDLLPVVDDFERAIQSNENTEDIEGLKEGFLLIYNKFRGILINKGLQPMDSMGQQFDADIHEAITNIPAPSEEDKGKVLDVVEKGYTLNEKVLRYAKVVVGQ